MADIRINALPTTATDFASDDYIAIDGTTNGTRKLNAKTANLTFSDVTLGSSGPSVKSSLSARAPRQGLVFDGTRGAEISGPTLGAGDWTFSGWVYCKALGGSILGGANNSLRVSLRTSGAVFYGLQGGANSADTSTALPVDKWSHLVITKSGTSGTVYLNGISIQTSTDARNYSAAQGFIGSTSNATGDLFNGVIVPSIYNRALSASEVVALYEAGAPAGADYNSASNTSIAVAATNGNFGGFSSTATSITATSTGGTGYCYIPIPLVKGYKYRIQFTSAVAYSGNSLVWRFLGDPGSGSISGTWSNAVNCTPNAGVLQITSTSAASAEFTPDSSDSTAFLHLWEVGITAGSNVSQSGISVTRLGLLLAPDAAQAGGGLTWYDTSGNAANITLPASGVSWNVPSSGYWGGNLTVSGGTITGGTSGMSLASGGTNQNITLTPSGTGRSNAYGSIPSSAWAANDLDSSFNAGLVVGPRGTGSSFGVSTASASSGYPSGLLVDGSYAAPNSTVNIKAVGVYSGGGYGASLAFHTSSNTTLSEVGRFTKAGNFIIGSPFTDSGQKLQVNGTVAFTGDLYSPTAGSTWGADSGATGFLVYGAGGGANANKLVLRTNSTTALTLDSSQNATFAGAITSSRPYQDISSGLSNIYVYSTDTAAQDKGGTIQLGGAYTGTTTTTFGGVRGSKESTTAGETGGQLEFFTRANGGAMTRRAYISSTGNATFTGSIAIGNTVNTVSPTSPNRTITMVIGGTTYYIHAKTTND